MQSALRLALLGAGTATFQTLFAREFLAAFSGNEAVLASLLGPWFLLTALGAFFGRSGSSRPLPVLLGAFGPVAVATLLAARVLPRVFPAGSTPGAFSALGYAVLLLAPACVLAGLTFSWLAADREDGGRAYMAESLGAAVAGAALSLLLLGTVPAFVLASGLVVASGIAAALSLGPRARALVVIASAVLAAPLLALPVDLWATAVQAPDLHLRARRESAYGTLVVAGAPGQATVFVDRRPVATATDPARAEELALAPLSLHPNPRTVAVVGVPAVGTARLLSSQGVSQIDLLVEDAVLLETLQREYPDFSGPTVRALAVDPRRWLADHRAAYDVVLVTTHEPTSAQLNRTFTAEFYATARAALRDGGLVAVALQGHAAFASQESRRLHSSVRRTLESTFTSTRVYPLELTLYVAAQWPLGEPAPGAMADTLDARETRANHLTRATLGQLLTPPRVADAERWASLAEPVNHDLYPTTYRLALDRTLAEFGEPGVGALALLAAALVLGGLLVFGPRSHATQLAVATSGGTGLATQLVVMLAYQIGTGALYREVGLILAGFMLGAAFGALGGGRRHAEAARARRAVLVLDLSQGALAVALWALLPSFVGVHGLAARALVFGVAALTGLLPGAQFAAAARATLERGRGVGGLYAADLLGAAVAALVTFTVLVPALGLGGVLLALAGVKVASSLALLLPQRPAVEGRPPLAPLIPLALCVFVLLAVAEGTQAPLYALTFLPQYQALVVVGLLLAALAAFEPARLREALASWTRRLEGWREVAGLDARRLAWFGLLLPVAAFPIARCYFKVPFVFCHVCPRQCVFGVMRPYAIPAAVVANLQGHRFCERLCPLGSAQAGCERLLGHRARRLSALWIPRILATAFVVAAWFLARADRGEGISGGPFFAAFFRNAFAPSTWVLGVSLALLLASLFVRRPFCEALCPVGAVSQVTDRLQRRLAPVVPPVAERPPRSVIPEPLAVPADRRLFLRRAVAGSCAVALGTEAFREFVLRATEPGLAVGFRNDAPAVLDRFSRPALFAVPQGNLVQCTLCPHACILGENDRGFCRTRVVKGGQLHTVAYGNLCAAHLDPIEKKPLYHYLPQTPILSVAIGGCNLRCLNCQNWEISQARPEDVVTHDAMPAQLVGMATEQQVKAIAYTYSEPLMAYEYVRDSAALARERGVKNVLVTAGYINEQPLRELCRVLDAVTLDVKAFRDSFYKQVAGARLSPVLRTLEVLKEEHVWTEVSFLMVPSLSDAPAEIADFAAWVAKHLGRGTPFHILRFHPAHRLEHLGPTPVAAMVEARKRAMDAGLQFVYLGNVPGHDANNTRCPRDGRLLIERDGYTVKRNDVVGGRCPCGEPIAGVFES